MAAAGGHSAQAQSANSGPTSGAPAAGKAGGPAVKRTPRLIPIITPQEAGALAKLPAPGPAEIAAQRRRIAALLEANFLYKGILDEGVPRLRKARISAPERHVPHSIFSSTLGEPEIRYCAAAEIAVFPSLPLGETRAAEITIKKQPDGSTKIQAVVHTSKSCVGPSPSEPFPELEQARNKHRAALGKPI
jgi:hypothetical protein